MARIFIILRRCWALNKSTQRYALGIEYLGTQYHGWQRQAHEKKTIQTHIETALSRVADHNIEVQTAGRTDAGVHASGQVIHFETFAQRENKAWILGVNTHLPNDIRVHWVRAVNNDFHARFSATARRYHYWIENTKIPSAYFKHRATHHRRSLDEKKMHAAAQALLGENDFSSFRAASCQSNTAMRNVMHCNVSSHKKFVLIDIKANAFLHHMVRNIAGSLIDVGNGTKSIEWFQDIFQAKDRTQAGITAPPDGLFLIEVDYPERFNLPINAF